MQVKISKPTQSARRVATIPLSKIADNPTIVLNKDNVISEHTIAVNVKIPYTIAPTIFQPENIGALLSRVRLNISGTKQSGETVMLDGHMLRHHNGLYENLSPVSFTDDGTQIVVKATFEIHHENDGAVLDYLAYLDGAKLTEATLALEMGDISSLFGDGAITLSDVEFSGEVLSHEYSHRDLVADEYDELATATHFVRQKNILTTGGESTLMLETGNLTRNLLVEVSVGGVGSDTALDSIDLTIGGKVVRSGKYSTFKAMTASKLGLDKPGVFALDFGNDEVGFLNLADVTQAPLVFNSNSPCEIKILQDFTR